MRPTQGPLDHSLARLVRFKQVLLEPGDLLFVPPTWWHVVEGCVDQEPGAWSCGINWFFTMPDETEYSSSEGERSEWDENLCHTEFGKQLSSIGKDLGVSRTIVREILASLEDKVGSSKVRKKSRN